MITDSDFFGVAVEREEKEASVSEGKGGQDAEERNKGECDGDNQDVLNRLMLEMAELKKNLEDERKARRKIERQLEEKSTAEEGPAQENKTREDKDSEEEVEPCVKRRRLLTPTGGSSGTAMHAAVTAPPKHPILTSDDEADCANFVVSYERYAERVELLAATGVVATVVPVKNCLTASALRCICDFELGVSHREVTSKELKQYLWGIRQAPSEGALIEQRRKVKAAIVMENGHGKRVRGKEG